MYERLNAGNAHFVLPTPHVYMHLQNYSFPTLPFALLFPIAVSLQGTCVYYHQERCFLMKAHKHIAVAMHYKGGQSEKRERTTSVLLSKWVQHCCNSC